MNELNTAQQKAVDYCDGPSLVIAGAGSGKTRVLTYKIAHLLEHGMYPGHILALTFTNKAAREMRERIGILVGEELSRGLWMGTFHSVFSRILRREAHLLGFNSDFTIYDANDSKTLVKHVIKDMGLDDNYARYYQIPFSTLVPEKWQNVIPAGRMVNADEGAFGALRVMINTNQMGEAAGTACALCLDQNVTMQQLDGKCVREALRKGGSAL